MLRKSTPAIEFAAVRLPKLQKNTQVCQKDMNLWTSSFSQSRLHSPATCTDGRKTSNNTKSMAHGGGSMVFYALPFPKTTTRISGRVPEPAHRFRFFRSWLLTSTAWLIICSPVDCTLPPYIFGNTSYRVSELEMEEWQIETCYCMVVQVGGGTPTIIGSISGLV